MRKNLFLLVVLFVGFSSFSQTTRLSLLEEFTGETCPPCAATNPGLNATLTANASKVIAIKWQAPIPSAPTNTWSLFQTNAAEINARISYYGVNSAPEGRMDGQSLTVFGGSSNHAGNVTPTLINSAQSVSSPFSITMLRDWDATCSSVNLTITVQASSNFTTTSGLNFRTVMVERLIQFSVQPGTNGEKIFEDVGIKSFPSIQSGYSLPNSWIIGQVQTFTLNCPIPAYTRNKSEIAFVGFIQNEANKNVLQAARVDKVAIPTEALTTLDAKVDVTCSSTIVPQISIKNSGANPITSFTITPYADAIAGSAQAWSGNLAVGASTTLVLNSITTATTNGAHTFSFQLIMNSPYNLINISNRVRYLVASNYQTTPVSEDFAIATFPPANWTSVNPNNGPSWSRVVNTGSYGNSSDYGTIKYDFYNNSVIGDEDEIYLPPMDLSGSATPSLSFDMAKAQRAGENDQLDVLVSNNCGLTWTNVFSNAGAGLATSLPTTSSFIAPNASDWITVSTPLSGFASPNVIVKFKTTNQNGNNMYIDNINLSQIDPIGIKKERKDDLVLSMFPNPSFNETNLKINSDFSGKVVIKIVNIIGELVYEKVVALNNGINGFKIDTKDFSTGVYFVVLDSEKSTITKKLVINK